MNKMPYIKIYKDLLEIVEALDAGSRGRLFLAIMQYANGIEPAELTGAERIAYLMVKGQIDRDSERNEATSGARAAAGRKGAENRWQNDGKNSNCHLPYGKNGNNKDKDKDKKDNPIGLSKKRYGEFENVMLLDAEHEKLVDSLGDRGVTAYIERLSAYIAQSGKKYKNHYATILNWWRRDGRPVDRSPELFVMKPDEVRTITPEMTIEEIF